MLCTLYILLEAGYFLHHTIYVPSNTPTHSKREDQSGVVDEWKRELASHGNTGAAAVNEWVDGWFVCHVQGGPRSQFKDVKRGNVETYLSGWSLPSYPH